MPEDFEYLQTVDPALIRKWVGHLEKTPAGTVLPRKEARQIAAALREQQKIIREFQRTSRKKELAFEAALKAFDERLFELTDALKQIASNGDGTGRNPQLMVDTAVKALRKSSKA